MFIQKVNNLFYVLLINMAFIENSLLEFEQSWKNSHMVWVQVNFSNTGNTEL